MSQFCCVCGEEITNGWKIKNNYICYNSSCVDMWFEQIADYWEEDEDDYYDEGECYGQFI